MPATYRPLLPPTPATTCCCFCCATGLGPGQLTDLVLSYVDSSAAAWLLFFFSIPWSVAPSGKVLLTYDLDCIGSQWSGLVWWVMG